MPSGEFDINDYNMGPTGMFNAGESLNEHFEAVRMLSEGAHAEVYEVFNHADNSPYVAKVPKNSGSSGQFSREASILKTLAQHRTPHSLIRAHPATEHRGQAILILEYLKGPTLKEHLAQKGGQLSVKESTGIIRDLLEALSALHGAGIAHGDVKPENIKILDRGAVLFDFSISQHVGDKEDVRSLGGSGHFKPPEKELTPAWDIFSTGVLLHLLIRGRLPQWDLGGSHSKGTNDILMLPARNNEIDCLDNIIRRSLAHSRTARYQSANDMLSALNKAAQPLSRYTLIQKRLIASASILILVIAILSAATFITKKDSNDSALHAPQAQTTNDSVTEVDHEKWLAELRGGNRLDYKHRRAEVAKRLNKYPDSATLIAESKLLETIMVSLGGENGITVVFTELRLHYTGHPEKREFDEIEATFAFQDIAGFRVRETEKFTFYWSEQDKAYIGNRSLGGSIAVFRGVKSTSTCNITLIGYKKSGTENPITLAKDFDGIEELAPPPDGKIHFDQNIHISFMADYRIP